MPDDSRKGGPGGIATKSAYYKSHFNITFTNKISFHHFLMYFFTLKWRTKNIIRHFIIKWYFGKSLIFVYFKNGILFIELMYLNLYYTYYS